MILFCDSSALVKLYILEEHSQLVKAQLDAASCAAVSRIAWTEVHSALSRRAREESKDQKTIEKAKQALANDWEHYLVVELDQALVELAGDFADTFALRAYDSIQLASALAISRSTDEPVRFASFDLRLNKAAKALGLEVL